MQVNRSASLTNTDEARQWAHQSRGNIVILVQVPSVAKVADHQAGKHHPVRQLHAEGGPARPAGQQRHQGSTPHTAPQLGWWICTETQDRHILLTSLCDI